MLEQKWNKNWKFWEDKDSFALVWNIPEMARDITLPHDAMIEKHANPDSLNGGNTGFRDGDVYTYVKMLHAPDAKSKLVAGLLGIFLGTFGVHNFYLGYTGKAITQLVLTIVGYILCCVVVGIFLVIGIWIWSLVEAIMILTGKINVDGKGNPLAD